MIVRPAVVGWFVTLCSVWLFGTPSVNAGESPIGKEIADVVMVNNRIHPREHILSQMQTRPGKVYDSSVIAEDVRRLIATKWFAPDHGVEVSTTVGNDGKVTVYMQFIELDNVVKSVHFVGAQHVSNDTLLQLSGIRKGSVLNPDFNRVAAQNIENKLREDGRAYATCRLVEGTKITDQRVVFNIVEGPVVKVKRVSIVGCRQTSSGRVATQLTIKAPVYGMIRFLNDKFNPFQVEEDKKKIINYFHKLGHLEARVQEELIYSRDLSSVEVIYHVEEGAMYRVRDIRLEGNKLFGADELRKLIELKQDERYDRDVIATDSTRIKNYYGYRGYFVLVEEQWAAVPGKPGWVDVVYQILEPQAREGAAAKSTAAPVERVSHQVTLDDRPLIREPDRVGRIEIRGNEVTKDSVIRNELGNAGIREGQILQYPSIEVARLNLFRRGIFDMESPPTVEVRQSEVDSTFKDVIVTVKETRTGQFLLGGAVNSNSGLTGNIAVNERNFDILRIPTSLDDFLNGRAFRGAGQELRLEAQPGTIFQRYSATFREPYLFNSNYGLTTSAYYYNRGFAEYDEDRYGARVSLDRRLDLYWRANFTTRIESVNVKNLPADAPLSIRRDEGQSTVLGLRSGITRDSRDSFIFPTSGSVLDVAYEQVLGDYTVPIGTAEYTKFFSSELLQRRDGSGKHVFAVRSQLSATSTDAPVFERFFAGGFRSLRGFTFRGVGPTDTSAFGNRYFVGGSFSFLNTLEYQIPLNAKDSLFFVTFLDHGTVERTFTIKDYRVSAGFGFRVQIPALGPVPVAFDFAFPLNKTDSDNRQVFAFYIGLFGGQ